VRIKKKKRKPILSRARTSAEAGAETRWQKIFRPVVSRWRLVAIVAGAVIITAGAVGGFFWYRNDREIRAARAYGRIQTEAAARREEAVKKAGKEGRVDEEKLAAANRDDLEGVIGRFGNTGAGRAAMYELASLYFEKGDYKKAAELFRRVRTASAGLERKRAAKGVGDCLRAEGDYKAAIREYQGLYEESGDDFPATPVAMALADCYRKVGKSIEAAKLYRRILDYHRLSPYARDAAQRLAEVEALSEGPD